ncbi:hypothetical protein GJ496_000986 [Pomphorhynchus laevis]|nr:hypothetical protein GJ496_000986 [Pomphorhynchus laevis]
MDRKKIKRIHINILSAISALYEKAANLSQQRKKDAMNKNGNSQKEDFVYITLKAAIEARRIDFPDKTCQSLSDEAVSPCNSENDKSPLNIRKNQVQLVSIDKIVRNMVNSKSLSQSDNDNEHSAM